VCVDLYWEPVNSACSVLLVSPDALLPWTLLSDINLQLLDWIFSRASIGALLPEHHGPTLIRSCNCCCLEVCSTATVVLCCCYCAYRLEGCCSSVHHLVVLLVICRLFNADSSRPSTFHPRLFSVGYSTPTLRAHWLFNADSSHQLALRTRRFCVASSLCSPSLGCRLSMHDCPSPVALHALVWSRLALHRRLFTLLSSIISDSTFFTNHLEALVVVTLDAYGSLAGVVFLPLCELVL
jgi:hypothetical protein